MDYFAAVRAFLHAAELESFSKTADAMNVQTSTVSRYIGELEDDLGIALFNRSTRGLVLTEGGRVFREHAQTSIDALDLARDAASALNESPQGVLRVAVPAAFGRRHVLPLVPEFLVRFPDIDLDLVVTDQRVNLIEGGIDLAVHAGVLPDSQLIARQLAAYQSRLVAAPEFLEKHCVLSPDDIAGVPALRLAGERWRVYKCGAQEELVALALEGRIRADDVESILALTLAGIGVSILPQWCVNNALEDGRLLRLLPDWEVLAVGAAPAVWAAYPPKKVVSTKVRAFIAFFLDQFSNATWASAGST